MSDTYTTEIYYHLIWVTKQREPMITPEVKTPLFLCMKAICRDKGVTIHALNAMPDHVHLACTLPTMLTLADLMHRLKGSTAHLINHLPDKNLALAWRPGYGALTFAGCDLPRITAYIQNQQRHHQCGSLSEKMERVSTPPD